MTFRKAQTIMGHLSIQKPVRDLMDKLESAILMQPPEEMTKFDAWMCRDAIPFARNEVNKMTSSFSGYLINVINSLWVEFESVDSTAVKKDPSLYWIWDSHNGQYIGSVISLLTSNMLKDYIRKSGFVQELSIAARSAVLYSYGAFVFTDIDSIFPVGHSRARLLLPGKARFQNANNNGLSYFGIKGSFCILDLIAIYKKVSQFAEADGDTWVKTGWVKATMEQAILDRVDKTKFRENVEKLIRDKTLELNVQSYQQLTIQDVACYCDNDFDVSQITHDGTSQVYVSTLYHESGGGVYCYVMLDDDKPGVSTPGGKDFLKVNFRPGKTISDFFFPIRDGSPTECGTIEGHRGVAAPLLARHKRLNVSFCIGEDSAKLAGTLKFQKVRPGSDCAYVDLVGAIATFPDTHQLVDGKHATPIDSRVMDQRLVDERYWQGVVDPYNMQLNLSSRPGRREVEVAVSDRDNEQHARSAIREADATALIGEICRRAYNDKAFVALFQAKLASIFPFFRSKEEGGGGGKAEGILKRVAGVSIKVSIPANQILDILQVCQQPQMRPFLWYSYFYSMGLPEEEAFRAAMQPAQAELDAHAAMENGIFYNSPDAVAQPTEDHPAHLDLHIGKFVRVAEAVLRGQEDPEKAVAWLSNAEGHILEHLQFIGESVIYSHKLEDYTDRWANAKGYVVAVGKVAERAKMEKEQQHIAQMQEISGQGQDGAGATKEQVKLEAAAVGSQMKLEHRERSFAQRSQQIAQTAEIKRMNQEELVRLQMMAQEAKASQALNHKKLLQEIKELSEARKATK
ncbi:MAG: hypothetical protein ACRCWR_06165 [Saezia sp.]